MTLKKRSVGDGIGDVLPSIPLSTTAATLVASARAAYLRGDFPECVSALDGRVLDDARLRAEALFIQARALIRLQRSQEVVNLLEPVLSTFSDVDEICTSRMLYGTAVARARDVDQGLTLLGDAAAFAGSQKAHRAVQAEIAYYRGVAYWTKRDYREASRYAKLAERAKLDILSVRAIQLRGFIALATTHFNDALQIFRRARQAYALCRGHDLGLATTIIHQIAFLEMNLRSAKIPGSHADSSGRTIPGTAFGPAMTSSTRMQLISADAWLYAIDGNRLAAFRKAYEAIDTAPNRAWRVWSLSSGAALFQAFGEIGNARIAADNASKIANVVSWNATTDEERIGLLLLAEVSAAFDPRAARAILARYDAVTSATEPTRLLRDRDTDPRLAGWDAYVRGLVARGLGEHDCAGRSFRKAIDLFHSSGYLWREALALLELDATPNATRGDFALERAAIIVRDNFPHSFIAERLGSWGQAYVDPVASKLTPSQRDVLRRLLDGKSPAAISEETNRAHSTVQTHIHHIHVAFGTHFERQLFAECNRRGIGSSALARRAEFDGSRRTS